MASADFTIADVLAWARTKPADERYDYFCNQCALGQFLVDTDRLATFDDMDWGEAVRSIDGIYSGPFARSLADCRHTFGALVDRLEALLPETAAAPSEWTHLDAYLTDIEAVSVPA